MKIKNKSQNKMAAMKRDVNLGLLLLIAAAIIVFSGFTVYYQTTFKNLSTTYQNELKQLDRITKDLESKRSLLNDTSTQLILKQQKEEDLSKKFTDVRAENEELEADKTKLEGDLASTKTSLASTSAKLTVTQNQLDQRMIELAQKITEITGLNSKISDLKKDVADRDKKIACLKSNGGTSESC